MYIYIYIYIYICIYIYIYICIYVFTYIEGGRELELILRAGLAHLRETGGDPMLRSSNI